MTIDSKYTIHSASKTLLHSFQKALQFAHRQLCDADLLHIDHKNPIFHVTRQHIILDEIVEVVACDNFEISEVHVGLDESLQVHYDHGLQTALGAARDVERATRQEVPIFSRVNWIGLLLPFGVRNHLVICLLVIPSTPLHEPQPQSLVTCIVLGQLHFLVVLHPFFEFLAMVNFARY